MEIISVADLVVRTEREERFKRKGLREYHGDVLRFEIRRFENEASTLAQDNAVNVPKSSREH